MQPSAGSLLWRAVNLAPGPWPRLEGSEDTDVAIVGGGVAGLSAALSLRQAGIEVAVIDGTTAARDGACASAGIVAPQLVRNSPAGVITKLGHERGGALLAMIAESGRYLFETVHEHAIACDPRPAGFLAPFAGQRGLRQAERVVADWQGWRYDVRLLDQTETRATTGCVGYSGAILDESGGGVDPVGLVDGLDRAAVTAGARIFRGANVTSVERLGAKWEVRTPAGVLQASRVLLCANGGNADLHPALRSSVLPLPVCEVATLPLPADMRAAILPHGHALTDISTDVLSLRFDRDGRLITALGASAQMPREEIERRIQARLEAVLPAYHRIPIEFVWHGTAWLNSSLLPRAVVIEDGLTAVQACNGRGLANNLIIGRELARWLHRPEYTPMVPLDRPRRVPGFALLRHVPAMMMAGSGIARRLFERSSTDRAAGGDGV